MEILVWGSTQTCPTAGKEKILKRIKVGPRVYGCHVKNFTIRKNIPLRMMEPNWGGRAMQFTDQRRFEHGH